MKFSRADRSRLAEWWFTVDHVLLYAILIVVATGLVLSIAASPAVALKKGLPAYYFVERHVFFSAVGVVIMFVVSLLAPPSVRRLS
ncbi:MAG: cell division protein FtsW, partial [Rhizobiales bacterium]|nr:cell division protein FtsW [Hyphomicrobiales bacterium]